LTQRFFICYFGDKQHKKLYADERKIIEIPLPSDRTGFVVLMEKGEKP
jgi:predicted carbohydrate-binding protein with CBM5 and CBM33 domain